MLNYHLTESTSIAAKAVTGRYLAHNRLNLVRRAFLGADLCLGATTLVKPTIVQAALLAGVNRAYVGSAIKRQAERVVIEAGFIPLVPPPRQDSGSALTTVNGHGFDDAELARIAHVVGTDRMLAAVMAAEQGARS